MPIQKITSGIIEDGAVSAADIVSVSNTAITGNIISSQITSVANTQISGNIISSQITSIGGSQITANTIANSAIQTGAVENYMNATGLSFGMRNRIINGAMVIDQRNAGAASTSSINGYFLDRWHVTQSTAGKLIAQQNAGSVTPPTGFINYLGVTSQSAYSIAAGDYYRIYQPIEGLNMADLAWGTASAATVTLSFWVRSSLTGTFGGVLQNNANNRSYPFSYTISSANTWEQKTITIVGDTSGTWLTTNGVGMYVFFGLGVGSTYSGTAGSWAGANYLSSTGATSVVGTNGATFYITGVQLEKGSTATSFDYRPYGTEMSLCQRYYWRTGGSQFGGAFMPILLGVGVGTGTSAVSFTIQSPVRTRVAASSITLGGSAVTYTPAPASVTTALTIDRATFDQTMMFIAGTGITLGTAYRINGNADATTFIEFLGMEL